MSANTAINQSPKLRTWQGKMDMNPTNHIPGQKGASRRERVLILASRRPLTLEEWL